MIIMQSINLKISPIQGYTPTERAQAISSELFAISRPKQVRQPEDVSAYLFGWITHPTTGECVLQGQTDYVINVHPENDITNLVALFPDVTPKELSALTYYIKTHNNFPFGAIIPSNAAILTDEQMQQGGWYGDITE